MHVLIRATFTAAVFFAASLRSADLALVGGTVYTQPDTRPIDDAVIVIRGKRIDSVGPAASVSIPRGAQVIDCSGNFIVAGFWNSHVHIFTPALLRVRDTSAAEVENHLDAMFNRWGFTTVFDIASVLDNTLALRARIERGEIRGPRVLTVGEPLWTEAPSYVRDYLAANRITFSVVTTPDDAAGRVRALARSGADGIKVFAGSMQGRGKVVNMPLSLMRAAADEAHRLHLPVFAHPQNLAGLETAIAAGVDILAHTAPDSPPWTPEFVSRLKVAGMALIPTLTLFDFEARNGGVSDQERRRWIDKMVGELSAFVHGGGEVLFGTDVGYTDHFDTALEFTLMSRAGMGFHQILAALTTNPARRFGYSGRSGRLVSGMDADVTVLASDPEKDATAFSRVRFTIRDGGIASRQNEPYAAATSSPPNCSRR